MSFTKIQEFIKENDVMNNFSCESKKCLESGKVVWNNSLGDNIHIRIDGCIFKKGTKIKRCDCFIIFHYDINDKIYSFFVEVQESYGYSLRNIAKQLESGIKEIIKMNNLIKEKSIIVPILYSKTHISNAKRVFPFFPIYINGIKKNIVYLTYGIEITNAIKE